MPLKESKEYIICTPCKEQGIIQVIENIDMNNIVCCCIYKGSREHAIDSYYLQKVLKNNSIERCMSKTNKKMNRWKVFIISTGWSVETCFKLKSVETCQSSNISAAVAIVIKNGSTRIAHIASLSWGATKPEAIEISPQFLAFDVTIISHISRLRPQQFKCLNGFYVFKITS